MSELLNQQYELNLYDEQEYGRWVCDSDSKADWILRKIAEARSEHDRLVANALGQIEYLKGIVDAENARLADEEQRWVSKLMEYWYNGLVGKARETKTQESYKLTSGSLVRKKEKQSIAKADDFAEHAPAEFVEMKPTVKWSEWKKELVILGNAIVDRRTGEVVQGVEIKTEPEKWQVKI